MIETTRRDVLAGSAALAITAALPAAAQGRLADVRAAALIDAIAADRLAADPENASALGVDTGARAALRSRLTDRSPTARARTVSQLRTRLAEVRAFDGATVDPAMRVHLDVIRAAYDIALKGLAFPYGDVSVGGWRNSPYVVCQNVGAYLDIPRFLDSTHKLETESDLVAYRSRLEGFAVVLDGETERLRAATAAGVIPPDFVLDKALRQLMATDPAALLAPLSRREGRSEAFLAHAAWVRGAADKTLAGAVRPALARQIAALREQRARAKGDAGVWALPQGDAYYAWALSAGTTTDRTPEAVHAQGLDELKRLQAEMDTILRGLGFTQGTVGARMTALGKDPRFAFPPGDPGRAEIMAKIEQRVADIRTRLPRAFRTLVKGNLEVRRLPPAEEPGAPGAYGGPGSIDGTIPGRFWINLRTTDLHTRYSLPTLTYHESIPGHVWQGEYSFRQPLIRSILAFNPYSEGWALYAEQLAGELGVYDDDPVGRLGYLQSIAFRACRLVVDTGLHAKRWTRAQAIDWFATTNGSGIEEVTSEVDRYCTWPGQACGYKVGHSEINRLRDRARTALGTRYDLRDFDDAVVMGGNVPMTVLAGIVDRYVAAKRA